MKQPPIFAPYPKYLCGVFEKEKQTATFLWHEDDGRSEHWAINNNKK